MPDRLTVPNSGPSIPGSPVTLGSPRSPHGGIRRKLVVIGDGACGKTSLLISYTTGKAPIMYVPTVFENYVASIPVDNNIVEMSLWDTAGQEDYDRLRPLSYPETDVLLICFSVDMPNSLNSVLGKWNKEISEYCPDVPKILVGCKADLRSEADPEDLVSCEQAVQAAETIKACKYLECSAKTGEGLTTVFEHAARASLVSRKKRKKSAKSLAPQSSLTSTKRPSKSKMCCLQ